MNTHSIHWETCSEPSAIVARGRLSGLNRFIDRAMSFFAAMFTAFVTIAGAAWIVDNPALVLYLQTTLWTAGLLYLGVAIEAEKPATSTLALATGMVLPALTFASQRSGPEWLIVAATLVAAWLAAAVYRFTFTARR